jgi:hypothetical protein
MCGDVDPHKPFMWLDLVNRITYTHDNGTTISEGDRDGYRVVMKTGETRIFMALMPGDMSDDWIDITGDVKAGRYIVSDREMRIPNLNASEVKDMNTELARHGRAIDEFDIIAMPQKLADQSGAIAAFHGTLTIRNRKTKAGRTYDTGQVSMWVVEFSDDLKTHAI